MRHIRKSRRQMFDEIERDALTPLPSMPFEYAEWKQRSASRLLETFEESYRRKSTLITAQLPDAQLHDIIGEPTIADAILDRMIQNPEIVGARERRSRLLLV